MVPFGSVGNSLRARLVPLCMTMAVIRSDRARRMPMTRQRTSVVLRFS